MVTDVSDVQNANAKKSILVTLLLKVNVHGDDVHRLQHPLPPQLLQIIPQDAILSNGKALTPSVLEMVASQSTRHVNGQPSNALSPKSILLMIIVVEMMKRLPILITLEGILTEVSDVHS